MKHDSLLPFFIGALLLCVSAELAVGQTGKQPAPSERKGYYTVRPLKDAAGRMAEITTAASTGATIPLWNYSLTSPVDGNLYSGQMVGRAPSFNGHRATAIQAYLVPVKLTFEDTGTVFNPSAPDSCNAGGGSVLSATQNSPLFQNASLTMNGLDESSTQYVDAFQRANFWQYVGNTPYHTLLELTTLSVQSISVPAAHGVTDSASCGSLGNMDIDWWDNYVQKTLIPALGISTNSFPIFLLKSVVMYQNGNPNSCCVLGYHSGYMPSVLQTYAVIDFDTTGSFAATEDISVGSHEIGEWMDDPLGTNPTPAWGDVGQVGGCQNNLEVGDPLSGILFPAVPLNGYTYHPQELAFYGWFYRLSPSLGAGGYYSDNESFKGTQSTVCK